MIFENNLFAGPGKWLVVGREGGLRTQRRHGSAFLLSGAPGKPRFLYESSALGTASRSGHTTLWADNTTLCVVGGRDDKLIELNRLKGCGMAARATAVARLQEAAKAGQLSKMSKTPGGRKNHACVGSGAGALLVFGGETFDGRSRGPVGTLLLICVHNELAFFEAGESAVKRAGAVCVVQPSSGKTFLHGGFKGDYSLANELYVM